MFFQTPTILVQPGVLEKSKMQETGEIKKQST
jgi:hypothetical protein